jgi:glutathione S-transferase
MNLKNDVLFSHDVVNIKLSDRPEWYFERNPLGKVPAIETESGDCLYESLIIADYLDEKYPEIPLHPKDPMQKAKDRIMIEHFSKVGITLIIFLVTNVCACPETIIYTKVLMLFLRY